VALLARAGGIPSTHEFHFNRCSRRPSRAGSRIPAAPPLAAALDDLPRAPVTAFSIDDATTTEIDDAFSVRVLPGGNLEVGIHIAAPALAIPRGAPQDASGRARLSTVYMPGRKITMLPDEMIAAFTLVEGRDAPALSLYVETDAEGRPLRHETRIERVPVAANLRLYNTPESFVDRSAPTTPRGRASCVRCGASSRTCRRRAPSRISRASSTASTSTGTRRASRVRRAACPSCSARAAARSTSCRGAHDPRERDVGAHARGRRRGGPLSRAGERQGQVLHAAGEHQGLGVSHYLWSSSPLRRYSDLVNQRQLIAVVRGEKPPYDERDPELYAILADFEATYAQYADFQDRMERYWCLRWLLQEGVTETTARVMRDTLVRFERIPLILRLADLPALPPETVVRVAVGDIDLLAETVECRYAGAPMQQAPLRT
jgi:exoribonuclease-2